MQYRVILCFIVLRCVVLSYTVLYPAKLCFFVIEHKHFIKLYAFLFIATQHFLFLNIVFHALTIADFFGCFCGFDCFFSSIFVF